MPQREKFLVLSAALLLLILGFELLCRLFFPSLLGTLYSWDKDLGIIPKPNGGGHFYSPRLYSFRSSHDENGFRRGHRTGRENPILLLGDSALYGIGVDDEETFSFLTQQKLDQCGAGLTLYNTGAPGRGPDYYLKLLRKLRSQLNPKEVLVFFTGHNDWKDSLESKIWSFKGELSVPVQPDEPKKPFPLRSFNILGRSFLLLRGSIAERKASQKSLPNPTHEQFKAGVKFLEEISKISNVKTTFAYLPSFHELDEIRKNTLPGTLQAFRKVSTALKLKTFPLEEDLSKASFELNDLFLRRDSHFSPRAHELISQSLYRYLEHHCRPVTLMQRTFLQESQLN